MSFSFPVLGNDDLLGCLEELNAALDEKALEKPTYENVKPAYDALVHALVGVTREELQLPVYSAVDTLEHPELHEGSVGSLASYRKLMDLMYASGVMDFSMKDIVKPVPARTKRNFSALVNFAKYREEKLALYEELHEKMEQHRKEKEKTEKKRKELEEELGRLEKEREDEEPEVQRLEQETRELTAIIVELSKEQGNLQAEVRELKKEGNELADRAANCKFEAHNAKQEAELLRAQLVQSPEKIRQLMSRLEADVECEKKALVEAERKKRELQAKLDVLGKTEREIQKTMQSMQETEAEINNKKGAKKEVKDLKAKLTENEEEVWRLDSEKQLLKRQMQNISERIQRLEHQGALKRDAAFASIEEQKREQATLETNNASVAAKISENQMLARSLQQKIIDLRSNQDAEVSKMEDKYHILRSQIHEYHTALLNAMEPPPELTVS
eukprot:jgi/Pico_ML_1/55372/g1066.t1